MAGSVVRCRWAIEGHRTQTWAAADGMACQYANLCLCMTVLTGLLILTRLIVDKSVVMNCHAGIEAQQQRGLHETIYPPVAIYHAGKVSR